MKKGIATLILIFSLTSGMLYAVKKTVTVTKKIIRARKKHDKKNKASKKVLSFTIKKHLNPFAPESTVMFFDLHGVLAKIDFSRAAKHFFRIGNKVKFIKSAIKKRLAYDLAKQHTLCIKHRIQVIETVNCQKINPETAAIVKQLKRRGYKLVLFSNIGSDALKELKKLPEFQQLFSLFDGFAISCAANNYCSKPSPQTYQHAFKIAHHVQPYATTFVLVDNKKKNITRSGMHGIVFRCAQQLRTDLQRLNIL